MTHNWKIKKQNFFCFQSKNFPPDKRHPGHRSRYGKYGRRSGYGFLWTACQPIRIENFEKPYYNTFLFITEREACTGYIGPRSFCTDRDRRARFVLKDRGLIILFIIRLFKILYFDWLTSGP